MENHFNCIYCYTNKVNSKKYVGQAVDFNKRHKEHFNNAHNPKHHEYNFYFSRSIRKRTNHDFKKYEEIYSVEILKEDLKTQEEINYWEDYYILEFDLLHNNGKGYNCKLNGVNGQIGNSFAGKTEEEMEEINRKRSETWDNKSDEELAEISRKKSEAYHNKSDEEKAEISRKRSETMNNKSDEEKAEISRKRSETRKKRGIAKGENNPHLGELVVKIDKDTLSILDIKYNFEFVEMGFTHNHIVDCCKGRYKTHKGYIFKYLSDCTDEQINEYIIKTKQIPVKNE